MTELLETPGRSRRKAKGSGHLRRGEIIEAAGRIFLECGYEGATIRKIADAVGVSSTALYMHFRDKGEILVEICETTFGRLLAQNTELAALTICPVSRVRRMLDAYLLFAIENPNAYQVAFCSSQFDLAPAPTSALVALSQRCYDLFLGAVQKMADAGRLRIADPEVAAQTSWAAAHGLVALLITRPQFAWSPRDVLMRAVVDVVLAGLVVDPPSDGAGETVLDRSSP